MMLGSIFLHLSVEGSSSSVRRTALTTVERLAATLPEHINLAGVSAASAYVSKDRAPAKASDADEQDASTSKEARLPTFMLACATFAEDCPEDIKQRMLWEWVLAAHHPGPCKSVVFHDTDGQRLNCVAAGNIRQVWVELCQKARVDPHELVSSHTDAILDKVFSAIDAASKASEVPS